METISFDLTKVEKFHDLKPYGKFTIKWKTRQGNMPRIIPLMELHMKHDTTMPIDDETDKRIVKFMKKHKTDILVNSRGEFYTRAGSGFTEVWHKKLAMYRDDPTFRSAVDAEY